MLNVSKGDSVILCGFTGIKLGVFEVKKATEKNITIEKKDGTLMVFNRKTGKQTNVEEGKEKYANKIIEDDGSYTPPRRKKKGNKTEETPKKNGKKKPAKKEEPEEEFEEEEIEDDDFEDLDDDFEDLDEE